jgi:hypothetical protein
MKLKALVIDDSGIMRKMVMKSLRVQLVLRKLAIVTQPSFLSPVCQETSTACL